MKKQCGAALGILIVFAWSGLARGTEMHTCALLTSGEVVAAAGEVGDLLRGDQPRCGGDVVGRVADTGDGLIRRSRGGDSGSDSYCQAAHGAARRNV